MKHQEEMNMSDLMNFDKEVVNYINDNLQYIKENAEACENKDLASESLEHYNTSVEAFSEEESYLSREQKERFLFVAKRLFDQGFVEHAGTLTDNSLQTASEKTISDLFRQHEVKADSVGDFLDRFYKPERYKGRGEEYAETLLASYQEEIKNRGFTFIPKHDSVTGYCVSYYEVRK